MRSSNLTPSSIRAFRNIVWKYYEEHGRKELPWRKTNDPYKILVSEMMLQQTQVDRVIPFYKNFIQKFPTVKALANAPLADVLIAWHGLGYNSRAKRFQMAAQEIVKRYGGKMPEDAAELESLPGIGSYTAHAVVAFAYNHDAVFIETNIRTVIYHYFFQNKEGIDDQDVLEIIKRVLPKGKAHDWYSALMDYGTHLKKLGVRVNAKSKTYTKQSKFSGSGREARGAILKKLLKDPQAKAQLIKIFGDDRKAQVELQIEKLLAEGLIKKSGNLFSLPL
jgi:A/G-specific adenine glycosylase